MKTKWFDGFTLAVGLSLTTLAAHANPRPAAPPSAAIPMDQLGVMAGKQYHGDGLSVTVAPEGALLRCTFQRLEGQVTREGLWLRSTANNAGEERFRVVAVAVGRTDDFEVRRQGPSSVAAPIWKSDWSALAVAEYEGGIAVPLSSQCSILPEQGKVSVVGSTARFIRPGLIEEYTVSMDGVRQDFIIEQRPGGTGELRLELDVTGATIAPLGDGVRLTLNGSGRKLAYHRLRVIDAIGNELPARMIVTEPVSVRAAALVNSDEARKVTCSTLVVMVDDLNAVYPLRIDPTFSDTDWISMGGLNGANSVIAALVADELGNLYIGGNFTVIGDVAANRIAKWDGNVWSALGSGIAGDNAGNPPTLFYPIVTRLAVSGTNLYAAGYFTMAGGEYATNIAKWNGVTWSSLGSGLGGSIYAVACDETDLYAGGSFAAPSDNAAAYLAKWDGAAWSALGSGVDAPVHALALSGADLFVGGSFNHAGGAPANCIAKWNGLLWSTLGEGVVGTSPMVKTLKADGTNLYVGGEFALAGGVPANRIALWNGSDWFALGSGMNSAVSSLATSGTNLYAAGSFTLAGGVSANRIARWNGSSWSALGSGIEYDSLFGQVLEIFGSDLYAAGGFTSIGGVQARYMAKWNGASWSSLPGGNDGGAAAMTILKGELYIGGWFNVVGGVPANYIAKWNGSDWFALGSGMNAPVEALTTLGDDLYAGGAFTNAGGVTVNHVAKWDGTNWAALGAGMNARVSTMAVLGTNLYAGGSFTLAGGASANRIAKWNGTTWSALNSGMEGSSVEVRALVAHGGDLYVGGFFPTAGGVTVSNIAKWDGSNWSALGSGMNAAVLVMNILNNELYAGGDFTLAGGVAANHIARWNGSEWLALGTGLEGFSFLGLETAKAMVVIGTNLYVGGDFRIAGGETVNNIAVWNGEDWFALGAGVSGFGVVGVSALAAANDNLFVGGTFAVAGNKVSAYLARAMIGNPPFPGRFVRASYLPGTGFNCEFWDGSIGQPYRIQTSPSLSAATWTDFTNFTYAGPVLITDASAGSATNRFFRAVTP